MANCNDEHFCQDKLLLDPKEASLKELVLLLFFSDVRSRKFVDCPEENRLRDINRRWLIFISVLVQKILLSCREPLAQTGHTVEYWLNLISNNGGLFKLLLNYLKDKVVRPDESSATFRSAVGHSDWRVELDKSSRPGEIKYNTSLSLMAAKLSYENKAFIETIVKDHWNMEFLGSYDYWNGYQERASTQALMFQDKKVDPTLIVVAFRGTNPFDADDWTTDVDLSWYDLQGIGHSLGGALAILFMGVLALHQEAWLLERLEGVYTFGQPRVGDGQFGEFMIDKLKRYEVRYMRHVYSNDIVPRLPYDDNLLLFKHFGPCIYFNSFYKGKVMQEEPNKNYFSLLLILPKYLNALWELIRSFIIPYLHGQDYRESWFMRLLRIAGLIVPGIPEHILQDYDNSTRLGSLQLKDSQQELHQE
uniref:Fungal lipase-type domain-containing protein n=1 Tax=Populus trichocarpa TaxID=3694 RepID=A0A3N7FXB5_POPTR